MTARPPRTSSPATPAMSDAAAPDPAMSDAATSTIAEIAHALGLEAAGDLGRRVARPAHPDDAGPDDLAVAMSPRFEAALRAGRARAAVLWPGADWQGLGLAAALFAPRPRFAMAGLTARFAPPPHAPAGIHPSAVVDPSAEIGEGASIGPLCVIGPHARIGARSRLMGQVGVGACASVGEDALIHAGVQIGAGVDLGARVIVHANAAIGADGFSFVTPEPGAVEAARAGRPAGAPVPAGEPGARAQVRIHSLGGVRVGDDVEIGAGATIDRGTLRDTTVGPGAKIDNLVQIGHNVVIGADCLICAQVGIAGSAVIGDRVVLGGKSGVADHAVIGAGSLIAAASGVTGKVPPGSVMMGLPALPRAEYHRLHMALRRLPRWLDRLAGRT